MPSANMEVVLLERVEDLGQMGEIVRVRPGYARNYLLPQKKALRATKDNIAYFEAQKTVLEKQNTESRKEAEKVAKKLEGAVVPLIRLASESGQLFGSVNSRDIAAVISEKTGIAVDRSQIKLNQALKTLGLIPVPVTLHPEVIVKVTVNIARSVEEAETQEKTGRVLIAAEIQKAEDEALAAAAAEEEAKKALLEDDALQAEKEAEEEARIEQEKEAKKAEARKAKKDAKAAEAEEEKSSEEEASEEASAEAAESDEE